MPQPRTIYDFYGFPQPLYEKAYPAPGSPALAYLVQETIQKTPVRLDQDWGLDHGTCLVLCRMFPDASIPVAQFSLDHTQEPAFHYELGRELKALRHKGVLIVGSGNMVHNLRAISWQDGAHDWALEFDKKMSEWIISGDHAAIIHYEKYGQPARLSVPTNEHFLPMLYILALQDQEDKLSFFAEKVTLGAISMRSFKRC